MTRSHAFSLVAATLLMYGHAGSATAAESTSVPATGGSSDTLLATLPLGPGHVVEFHKLPSGQTSILERMPRGEPAVVPTLLSPDEVMSLAAVHQFLRPDAEVPAALASADVAYAGQLAASTAARSAAGGGSTSTLGHAAEPAAPSAATSDLVTIGGPGQPVYDPTTDPQLDWFTLNVCLPNNASVCTSATSIVSTGQHTLPVQYWGNFAMVGSNSSQPGTFLGYQLDIPTNSWMLLWNDSIPANGTEWRGVNPAPQWTDSSSNSTFVGYVFDVNSPSTELDIAANWNLCGGAGQLACPGNVCASGFTPIGGSCAPIATRKFACTTAQLTTGNLGDDYIELDIANTGDWVFFGNVYDTGAGADSYFLGINLTATNASGQQYAQGHSGTVYGWAVPGPRTNVFTFQGNDGTVPNRWSEILGSGAQCHAQDTPNVWSDIAAAFSDVGLAAVAILTGGAAASKRCQWEVNPNGSGASYVCTP